MNDATSENAVPVLLLHANVLVSAPARPQSFHAKSISPGGKVPTWNVLSDVAVPPGFATVTGPSVAPLGTGLRMSESETTVNVAGEPWNRTSVTRTKLYQRIEIVYPTGADRGAKPRTIGATTNGLSLTAAPCGVVT